MIVGVQLDRNIREKKQIYKVKNSNDQSTDYIRVLGIKKKDEKKRSLLTRYMTKLKLRENFILKTIGIRV